MDVEGDYSQAAFLAVLGSTVGGITITGLPSGSHQGDRVILDILKQCGAKFERSGSHVTFHRSLLKAVEIDLADCPDLGPVLIALGCFCSGTTENFGGSRSLLVNASTWALMLTGKVLDDDQGGIAGTLRGAIRRLGEPVIRTAVGRAMKEMGRQFALTIFLRQLPPAFHHIRV